MVMMMKKQAIDVDENDDDGGIFGEYEMNEDVFIIKEAIDKETTRFTDSHRHTHPSRAPQERGKKKDGGE